MDISAQINAVHPWLILQDGIVLGSILTALCILWCRYFAPTYNWRYNAINGVRYGALVIGLLLLARALYLYQAEVGGLSDRGMLYRVVREIPLHGGLLLHIVLVVSQAAIALLAWRFFRPLSWLEANLWWKNSHRTRVSAIQQLSQLVAQGNAKATNTLLRFAAESFNLSRFPDLRKALVGVSSQEVHTLLSEKARGFDSKEAEAAIGILGEIGRPKSVEVLLKVLLVKDVAKRVAAVNTLARLGNPDAIAALLNLATESDSGLVEATWHALNVLGASHDQRIDFCLSAIKHSSRKRAAEWLGDLGDPRGIPAIYLLFKDEYDPHGERSSALCSRIRVGFDCLAKLRATPDQRLEACKLAAKNRSAAVRELTVGELGALQSESALEILISLCGDESGAVCAAAINTVEQLKATREQLIRGYGLALSNANVRIREKVAQRLADLGGNDGASLLLGLCGDASVPVCMSALNGLTKLNATHEQMLTAYGLALSNSDVNIRTTVAHQLSLLGGSEATILLLKLSNDPSPVVFRLAVKYLEAQNMPSSEIVAALDSYLASLEDELVRLKKGKAVIEEWFSDLRKRESSWREAGVSPYVDYPGDEGWRMHWRDVEKDTDDNLEALERARKEEVRVATLKAELSHRKDQLSTAHKTGSTLTAEL